LANVKTTLCTMVLSLTGAAVVQLCLPRWERSLSDARRAAA